MRKATGTVQWVPPRARDDRPETRVSGQTPRGHYKVRITLPDGARPWIHLDPGPRSPAAERTARRTAEAYSERARAEGIVSVRKEHAARLPSATAAGGETVARWFDRYLAWRDGRGFATVRDTRGRIVNWVLPVIGAKGMREVTRDDVEEVVRRLDAAIAEREAHAARGGAAPGGRKPGVSWKTAANVWGDLTHAFDEACHSKDRSLRVLEIDPTDGVRGTERGVERSKPILYPDEVAALLSCERVPLYWRRMYAMAVYTGARSNELDALTAGDVDLGHATISVHKQSDREHGGTKATKTRRARVVDIEPELLPLVRLLVSEAGEGGKLLRMPPDEDRAELLRRHLGWAGCDRDALSADDSARAPIKFHNLRDTCLTHMARRGDDPLRIQWRAGHTAFAMTEKYIAEARRLPPNFGRPLPPLPPSLLAAIVPANRPADGWKVSSSRSHTRNPVTPTGIEPVLPT
jgi:integrase